MRFTRRLSGTIALILILSTVLSVSAAAADTEDLTDVHGHWAEEYLFRGISEGLLSGYGDGTLRPDNETSLIEALVLLQRILRPVQALPAEETEVDAGAWYGEQVLSVLSIVPEVDVQYLTRGSFTRGRLFLLMADAFRLIPAQPDHSVLDGFADADLLTGRERDAAASLISMGYVSGHNGALRPLGTVTRAELFTLAFSIVENSVSGGRVPESFSGGALLQQSGDISGRTYSDILWLAGSAENCDISGLDAGTLVFLSQTSELKTDPDTRVDTLVLAGGTGSTLASGTMDTVRVAAGAPESVYIECETRRLEITADNVAVTVGTHVSELVISGANCTVVFTPDGAADTVILTDAATDNVVSLPYAIDELRVAGVNNSVTVSGGVKYAELDGVKNLIDGDGPITSLTLLTRNSTCSASALAVEESFPGGLGELVLSVDAPKFLAPGENLTASASLSNPETVRVELNWYLGGVKLMTESLDVGPFPVSTALDLPPELSPDMAAPQLLRLTVTLKDAEVPQDAPAETVTRQYLLFLENLDTLLPAEPPAGEADGVLEEG